MPVWLGYDYGYDGALAGIDAEGLLFIAEPLFSTDRWFMRFNQVPLWQRDNRSSWWCSESYVIVAGVEEFMLRTAKKSQAKSCQNHGRATMWLELFYSCPTVDINSHEWKAAFGLSSNKTLSVQLALELWPDAAPTLSSRHDIAEAALIAKYTMENYE